MSNRARRSTRTTPTRPAPDRRRVLLIGGALLGLVVVIGLVISLSGASDDGDGGDEDTTPAFGPVVVEGGTLPRFSIATDDPAEGLAAPVVEGTSPEGDAVTIGGAGEPTLVVFLAHWCPHCQREVPVLVPLMEDGRIDGLRTVGVLTSTSRTRPNFPPVAWLEREGWSAEVLLDDDTSQAAKAYGLNSFPYFVLLDEDGKVVERRAGELGADALLELLDAVG